MTKMKQDIDSEMMFFNEKKTLKRCFLMKKQNKTMFFNKKTQALKQYFLIKKPQQKQNKT